MFRIRGYYKPFIWAIMVVICLLSIQAICDLKLPDYMSEIVNVGIQSNGIEKPTPIAISENAMDFITSFMNETDRELTLSNYTKIMMGNNEYIKEYPLSDKENIYILNDINSEDLEKLDNIFSVSSKALLNILSTLNNLNSFGDGSRTSVIEVNSEDVDLTEMYQMLPIILNMSPDVLEEAKQEALNTEETMLSSIGRIFVKIYYTELGIDVSKIQSQYLIKIGFRMIGVSIIGGICTICVSFISSKIAASVAKNLRSGVFKKVQEFSSAEYNKFSAASLITRTTNDITQVQQVTAMGMRLLLFSPIMGIGALLMMLQKGKEMAWTLGVGLIGVFFLILLSFIIVIPKFKIIQKLADKLNLVSKENLTGIMVIRAFRTNEHEEKRFDEVNIETTKITKTIGRLTGFMMPCMMLIMNLLSVLIIWVGADMIEKSTIQVGDMMAFIQYAMHVLMSCIMLTMISILLPRAGVSATRIAEILETKNSIKNPENPVPFNSRKTGYIEFKNVSFSYEGASEKVLDNINFVAKPGETTAFIGSTGSGKSTLINLIPRFYDPTQGEVFVNGINVKEVELSDLYNQIGYIPQKGNLLSGTIKFNLKYGNPNANDDFMKKCAQIAQATEFIEEKDDKYESEVSQGAKNVSGGQKQRLSIARALVKDPKIYIFDDSFSALDFKTDAKLREELKKNTGESTILIVAQRVNTIMDAEQIIVLDEGKIVGRGTHKELLANCPIYYEIASSQLTKEELENGRK